MGSYLFRETDENICLYNGYIISNPHMNDDLLEEFNLKPTCEKKPENNSTRVICYNTLRFTDLTNSSKLYDGDTVNGTGIEDQVTCKLCFRHHA